MINGTLRCTALLGRLLFVLLVPATSQAIVTSDDPANHLVEPGAYVGGLDLSGVGVFGFAFAGEVDEITDVRTHCTGSLITDHHVLSAAHCFDLNEDLAPDLGLYANPEVPFFIAFDTLTGTFAYRIEDIALPAEGQADVAVVRLAEPVDESITRYSLYGGAAEVTQPILKVGYGSTGHGSEGVQPGGFFLPTAKHAGLNRFDYGTPLGTDEDDKLHEALLLSGKSPTGNALLAYDFDSGRVSDNSLAEFDSDLGFGSREVSGASGDSGGPSFLGPAIAGVTSFGISKDRKAPVESDTENTKWGSIGLDERVASLQEFIQLHTADQATFVDFSFGDFDADGQRTLADLDELTRALRQPHKDSRFDVNLDGRLDQHDRIMWVELIQGTQFGDANLDGVVNMIDFLSLSGAYGKRSDDLSWENGDFTGDAAVDFEDFLVLANTIAVNANTAGFTVTDAVASTHRTADSLVPEPRAPTLMLFSILAALLARTGFRHRWPAEG